MTEKLTAPEDRPPDSFDLYIKDGEVRIRFSRAMAWIGISVAVAREMAAELLWLADELDKTSRRKEKL